MDLETVHLTLLRSLRPAKPGTTLAFTRTGVVAVLFANREDRDTMRVVASYAKTHTGRRSNNEDSFVEAPGLGLYAVADGMGGYEGGEVASALVTETLHEFFGHIRKDPERTWPFGFDASLSVDENMLSVAVRLAHKRVEARKVGPLSQMGSTVAALLVRRSYVVLGHVGDSRIYRMRHGKLERLTRDHSFYEQYHGHNPDAPPRDKIPYGNVLTRAIGCKTGPIACMPEIRLEKLLPGDTFLLCTDGLQETLADKDLEQPLQTLPPQEACGTLVQRAYTTGGRDNITAIVLQCAA